MYETAAGRGSGDTPATMSERLFSRVQTNLLVCRRTTILPEKWVLDLYSPFWRLYLHASRGATVNLRGKVTPLKPGIVYLIPAWVHFTGETTCPLKQEYVHFYLTGIPPTLARQVFDDLILLPLATSPIASLVRQWQASLSADENPGVTELFWGAAVMQAGLAAAVEQLPAVRRALLQNWAEASHPFSGVLHRIETNLANPPSNEELAASCGQSVDHFVRCFKAATGLTPARFGIERRIAIATQRLVGSDLPIETIAAESGFADRFHFSRVFRSVIGMPPARFRATHARH